MNEHLISDIKRLLLIRYSRLGSEIAQTHISYKSDLKYHTAATDGKEIYLDPEYFASLNEEDRIFLVAHEFLHIKFAHVFRLNDKNGEKKDLDVWNEATDAIINANLKRDGFHIKEGYVNRPEALHYSANEFYEILLKEKEQQKNTQESTSQKDDNQKGEQTDGKHLGDDHSLWEEAFEKQQDSFDSNDFSYEEIDESVEFSENRKERIQKAKENLEHAKEQVLKNIGDNLSEKISLGEVGQSKHEIDWRILVRKEVEKTETIWSQRRSIAENNYAYRLEENDIEDEAETEVLIDVSGSVDLDLVKAFLRMLKPLLKHSKLKVGCFNEKFWGMVEVKANSDIDHFEIPAGARGRSAQTEDWDLAVRSFTRKKEINKIVFTDGIPGPGNMPKEDLKNENIIWLVYGNPNFHPCCGKVILITESQLERLFSIQVPSTKGRLK